MLAKVATLVATVGYAGFFPIAPGTVGSAVGLVIYAGVRVADSIVLELAIVTAVLVAGIWSAGHLERELGKDPAAVVIDEVLGMLLTLALLDVSMAGALAGFFIFRILDVIKPFPAGRLEHLHGGFGIMMDDVMAGIYSNLLLRLSILLFPGLLA